MTTPYQQQQQHGSPYLTPAELGAIRGRVDAATPGPWTTTLEGTVCVIAAPDGGRVIAHIEPWGDPRGLADRTFLTHARTDMPRLLALVEALSLECEEAARALVGRHLLITTLATQRMELREFATLAAQDIHPTTAHVQRARALLALHAEQDAQTGG